MFSGIVETIGLITQIHLQDGCKHFSISPDILFDDIIIGDSIAVNGVCLTVTHFTDTYFNVTAVPETLRLTNLNDLQVNDVVNLERSLKMGDRIGGHHVQGHVDGCGQMIEMHYDDSAALLVKFSIPRKLSRYIIEKGYITIDGMSITVIDTDLDWFTVTFIPHTQAVTNIQHYAVGKSVNLEVDIMGKYIEKMLGAYAHANTN
jgi:riboflavin synthase